VVSVAHPAEPASSVCCSSGNLRIWCSAPDRRGMPCLHFTLQYFNSPVSRFANSECRSCLL
jgi:hypothetical protein